MVTEEILNLQNEYLIPTYAADLVLTRGQGCRVWDAEGNEYLDFTSGISVCNLGHCHPAVTEAIQRQAATLVHVSNLFANDQQPQAAAKLARAGFDGRVFFANSGAEANEGLIKFARKWGSERERHEIICMEHCFHGRTITTLSATDKPAIRKGFGPLTEGFTFVPFNNLEAIEDAITDQTAAVLVEPIQGEGGVIPAAPGFLQGLRQLCDKYELLLLFDEVQTGIGRTGELFAYQLYDVMPDAVSLAKALGNGYPVGAFMIQRRHEAVLGKGSHASTFGGTALACAAVSAVLDTIRREEIMANVQELGPRLKGALIQLAREHEAIVDVRGPGLMVGLQLASQDLVDGLLRNCRKHGLLLMAAAGQVVRVYPPLTIDATTLDAGIAILQKALGELG